MNPPYLRLADRSGRARGQRGMVTVFVMLFVIAAVIVAMVKMLEVSSAGVGDAQQQTDSTAAFFLAESGLDTAQSAVAVGLGGTFSNTTCTNIAAAIGTVALGRGSFSVTAQSEPPTCLNNSATGCDACNIVSTGVVGKASRAVEMRVGIQTANGVTCNGATANCSNNPTPTWTLNLQNTSGVPALGLFALSYDQQGSNTATCPAGVCRLQIALDSPNSGTNAIGLQGNAVTIPAGGSFPIYQVMSRPNNSVAEVGVFFRGTAGVTLTGPNANPGAASYWRAINQAGNLDKTIGVASGGSVATQGSTNDGAFSAIEACSVPGSGTPSLTEQACKSWCHGGDTVAYVFSGNTTVIDTALTGVTFGTNTVAAGTGAGQHVALTPMVQFPTSAVPNPPVVVDAEIWYASNQRLVSLANEAVRADAYMSGVSSYKGRGSGAVGARWVSNAADATRIVADAGSSPPTSTLTVGNSFTAYPDQIIHPGDTVTVTVGTPAPPGSCSTNCGVVTLQLSSAETGGVLGGRGTYRVSGTFTVASANSRLWTSNSNVLHVRGCSVCFFANGDALGAPLALRTISGNQLGAPTTYGGVETTGGVGRYPISGAATYVALAPNNLFVGTPGTTLYLPVAPSVNVAPAVAASPSLPASAPDVWPRTMLSIRGGTGVLAPRPANPHTQVLSTSAVGVPNVVTRSFVVSVAPTTALDNASLCAGTCAFFVPQETASPPSATVRTQFTVGITPNFNYWTSGFTCMRGVDIQPVRVTASSLATTRQWREPVQ